MFKSRYKGHHTICETLREIYQLSNDENIKLMHERLKKYKKEADGRKKREEEKRQKA